MNRLSVIRGQLCPRSVPCSSWDSRRSPELADLMNGLNQLGVTNVDVKGPPVKHEQYYSTITSPGAIQFVTYLVQEFDAEVDEMLAKRAHRKLELDRTNSLPDFVDDPSGGRHGDWKVRPVPRRLRCRHVDVGDVSPSNTDHFMAALKSPAQGIQTDFDDGHCPTWPNQLRGLYNVYQAVHDLIPGVPKIAEAPVLMLRPRAWNMVEHNMLVDGKEVPGPLFDFGLLMYHNARVLLDKESGPFFYLSKLEGSGEAALWDRVFTWTEAKLALPHGCIKACVLIENVLASFELEGILYALRDHSAGLNCGIWDYSASFISTFGHRKEFILPDRYKYVSMERHFLKSYLDLVVKTCHRRGCHATGGMAALLLPPSKDHPQYSNILETVLSGKKKEVEAGVDGFMVFDLRLIPAMQQMFSRLTQGENKHTVVRADVCVLARDLLLMPTGCVTLGGLKHNITVGTLFIEAWLRGQGHFYLQGVVEDSATAEISRSQVWQWIRHKAFIKDDNLYVTIAMVETMATQVVMEMQKTKQFAAAEDKRRLQTACNMLLEIVTKRDFPNFITTYLNLHHTFLNSQEPTTNNI